MRHLFLLVFATSTVSAAPVPAEIARRHLSSLRVPLDEMGKAEVTPVGRGWVARFRQTHAGLPVIGGELVVRVDESGKVRRHAGETFDLRGFDPTARVTAGQAIDAVRAHSQRVVAGGEIRSILAIDPGAVGGPRLVWAVRPTPMPQLLENAIYLVDAKSGALLKRFDLLKYGKASVFLENPVDHITPEPRDFPTGFEPTNPDGFLEGALLKSYDCLDKGEVKDVSSFGFGNFKVHICTVTPSAQNAGFDYTTYQPQAEPLAAGMNGCPGAPMANDPTTLQPIDEFSEAHMYWHVADIYNFMRGLFADNNRADWKLRAQPLAMAVNLCTIDFSQGFGGAGFEGPLVPFDNAFFSPGQGNPIAETLIMGQDSIMFGQGSKYDFAYDGDVIKHEFVHAVIDTLGKLVKGGELDVWGVQDDQGAMNEALADYFSSVIAGNPELGDYAGRNIPTGMGAEGAIRNLENQDQCGRDRWGEVHQDSQAFSASLWQARVAIAGNPNATFDAPKARLFDRAVLAALSAFAVNVDMTQAANDIADEVGMLLDAAAKDKLVAAFTAHKILPVCDRVIDYTPGDKKSLLGLDGTDSPYAPSGATRVPGFVQWKIDVPVGADAIIAHLTVREGGSFSGGGGLLGGSSAPKLELVAGPPGEPVQWVLKSSGGNEVATAAFDKNSGAATATLGGLSPGVHHVMIVNAGGGAIGQNISFDTGCTNPAGCAPDMATAAPPDLGSGCKCDVGGNTTLSLAPLLLLALAVFLLRRRAAR
jgi:MYXO-CTERM domain-containing protein